MVNINIKIVQRQNGSAQKNPNFVLEKWAEMRKKRRFYWFHKNNSIKIFFKWRNLLINFGKKV